MFLFCLTIVLFYPQAKHSLVDILLVEFPNNLVFYNRYEQKIPKNNLSFPSNFPIEIMKRNTFLSDKLTPCMEVTIEGIRYFIKKDEKKHLVNAEDAGEIQLLLNATKRSDRIEILKANRFLYFHHIYKQEFIKPLQKKMYKRLFERNGYSYLELEKHIFAWVKLDRSKKNNEWRIVTIKTNNEKAIPEFFIELVTAEVKKYNRLYHQMYTAFTFTNTLPEWNVRINEATLFLTFEPQNQSYKYSESIRFFTEAMSELASQYQFVLETDTTTIHHFSVSHE